MKHHESRAIFLVLMIVCSALRMPVAFAQASNSPDPMVVLVHVRAVKALDLLEGNAADAAGVVVDKTISDLTPKLRKLHFKTFKLLSSYSEQVPIKKKQMITLVGGNTLTVRPLYVENTRTGMWLRWTDSSGMELLDTRMHFDCGESMLTGTDSLSEGSAGSGLILAIDVKPVGGKSKD